MARYMVNPELNILLNNRKDISGMVSTIPDFLCKEKTLLLIAGIVWMIAGVIFTRNYLFYSRLMKKGQD